MSDLAMNFETNDLDIKNGDLYLVDGDTAIQQDWQQQLQLWLGEWFLNTTKGVPYKQQILVKNPNIDLVQADLTDVTTGIPGIVQVLDFSIQYTATRRSASVFIAAQTSNGQTITAQVNVNLPTNATIEGTPI